MKEILYLLLFTQLFSCGIDKKKKIESTIQKVESTKEIGTKNNLTLGYLQGTWRSYSYYLEQEQENKDFHINEYYMVVNGKKSLEVILKQHNINNTCLNTNNIGFIDKKKENVQIADLKEKGKLFIKVKSLKDNIKSSILNIEKDNISKNFESYFDGNDIFDDYFDYQFKDDTKSEKVTFIRLFCLPKLVYQKIKTQSKKDNRDYISEFNIKGFSQKIQVTADKTYFYNNRDLTEKSNAYLVKGDIAYLENIGENEVQVYFDGEVLTSGFIKLSDVKVIE